MKRLLLLKNRNGAGGLPRVSLFPFLAVLICTMGALVLLLLTVTRQARLQAVREAAVKQAERHRVVQADREKIRTRVAGLKDARAVAQALLGEARSDAERADSQLTTLREQATQFETAQKTLEETHTALERRNAEAGSLLDGMRSKVGETEQRLDAAKQSAQRRNKSYAIIPYEGPNATHRRPIYLECRAHSIVLQPEGITFFESDFDGPLGRDNPLAAAIRAACEYLPPGVQREGEPYPLLLVRPSGIMAYYAAREALKSHDTEFGYELVNEDWDLRFPPPDLQLAQAVQRAVEPSRRRQHELAASQPQRAVAPRKKKETYRALAGGGLARVGNAGGEDEDDGAVGPFGQPAGAGGDRRPQCGGFTAGGLAGRGPTSGGGYGAPGGYAGSSGGARGGYGGPGGGATTDAWGGFAGGSGGTGPTGGLGGGGYGAPGGGIAGGGSAMGMGTGSSVGGSGGAAGGTSLGPSGGSGGASGPGGGGGEFPSLGVASGNGEHNTAGGSVGGAPNSSGNAGMASNGMSGGAGEGAYFATPGAALADGKSGGGGGNHAGSGRSGVAGAASNASSGGSAGNVAGGGPQGAGSPGGAMQRPEGYVAGRPVDAQASAAYGRAYGSTPGGPALGEPAAPLRPGEWRPEERMPYKSREQAEEEARRDKKDKDNPRRPSVDRGRNWALRDATRNATAVTRPITIRCYADRLVIAGEIPSRDVTVALPPSGTIPVDRFVSEIWKRMGEWGIAGKGMYWHPVLKVRVDPAGEARFAELTSQLEGSGITVERAS